VPHPFRKARSDSWTVTAKATSHPRVCPRPRQLSIGSLAQANPPPRPPLNERSTRDWPVKTKRSSRLNAATGLCAPREGSLRAQSAGPHPRDDRLF